MKLYFSSGACSLAPHILLRETGLPFTLVRVDLKAHQMEDGGDYYGINPKGSVPVLELDDGERLTEGPVIAQLICDRAKRTDLMPAAGTLPRYRVMEWQNYISTELHKSYSPLFRPDFNDEGKNWFRAALRRKYQWVESQLQGKDYLTGSDFTAADAYLFTITRWAASVGVDLKDLASVQSFTKRVGDREAVKAAQQAEAPSKKAA